MEFLVAPLEFVLPTTEPAPNRFGWRRELRICGVFIALEAKVAASWAGRVLPKLSSPPVIWTDWFFT